MGFEEQVVVSVISALPGVRGDHRISVGSGAGKVGLCRVAGGMQGTPDQGRGQLSVSGPLRFVLGQLCLLFSLVHTHTPPRLYAFCHLSGAEENQNEALCVRALRTEPLPTVVKYPSLFICPIPITVLCSHGDPSPWVPVGTPSLALRSTCGCGLVA